MDTNSTARRKKAIDDYKARKPQRGAFAMRCSATGAAWVGTSPALATVRNRLWFALRLGGWPDKPLQAEWNRHGEGTFAFEVLEALDDDVNPFAINDRLKDLKLRWAKQLNADTLV